MHSLQKIALLLLACTCFGRSLAQTSVGIGTTSPQSSAALDVTSTSKGLLPPRMNWSQIQAIASPVAGLTVYDIGAKAIRVYDGTQWTLLAPRQGSLGDAPGSFSGIPASTPYNISATAIGTDKSVVIAGSFTTPTMSIGSLTVAGGGVVSGFIARLDSNGTALFLKAITSTTAVYIQAVALDPGNNIYAGGDYSGTADLDPSFIVQNVTSLGTNTNDVFIVKLGSAGTFSWGKSWGGTGNDDLSALAADAANVYAAGDFYGTASFASGSFTSAGNNDGWVAKYSAATGLASWAARCGGASSDRIEALSIYSGGGVAVGGEFALSANFGTYPLTSAGSYDGFIAFVNGVGTFSGAYRLGGTGSDEVLSLATDAAGKVYVGGYYSGTANLAINGATSNVTAAGSSYDVFFAAYASSLALAGSRSFGGTGYETIGNNSLVLDAAGNVYGLMTAGSAPTSFLSYSITPYGGGDAVFLKMNNALSTVSFVQHAGNTGASYPGGLSVSADGSLAYHRVQMANTPYLDYNGVRQAGTWYLARYEE